MYASCVTLNIANTWMSSVQKVPRFGRHSDWGTGDSWRDSSSPHCHSLIDSSMWSITSIWPAGELKAFCERRGWRDGFHLWFPPWQLHYMIQERARLYVNPPSIRTKALFCFARLVLFSPRIFCEEEYLASELSARPITCGKFVLCKHTAGKRGTVCSISECLIPSLASVGPAVCVPRQSCVNRGSTVVITAGSDETYCLRVRGEVCQLDCTVCSRCWLWVN